MAIGEDIYEYHFSRLFEHIKSVIGGNTIQVYDTKKEEQEAKELDEILGYSRLLFDVSGNDFKRYKECESDYKYWVEVYTLKIIESLMKRLGKEFQEKYHPGCIEQHSIVYESDRRRVEAYFLFDIEYREAVHTDYDKIADSLKANSENVDKIIVFIFRDHITPTTLAWLINENDKMSTNGFIEVLPLRHFFDKQFGTEEFAAFIKFVDKFRADCNRIISYKTIIRPTQKTITSFKQKKLQMLREMNYLEIANKGKSGELSEREFIRVRNSFLNNKMYTAMVGSNDYADSFISAEWSYDVYSNSMGELELTGIIAGYLKSIEQLMYTVARFHRDQGIRIKTSAGFQPYTSDNEQIIDSTLGALNEFIKSSKDKLALSVNIRGCIYYAVDLWRKYQRNGYFHKDNLYLTDNKIGEVRELTLYLYFLILGGISFSTEEIQSLGVIDDSKKMPVSFDEDFEYPRFKEWFDNVYAYDLPNTVPGIWILLTHEKDTWRAHPYLMKYFNIDDYENGSYTFESEHIVSNHVRDIPPFTWKEEDENRIQASSQFQRLLNRYENDQGNDINRIRAIILGLDKEMQLIYFCQ